MGQSGPVRGRVPRDHWRVPSELPRIDVVAYEVALKGVVLGRLVDVPRELVRVIDLRGKIVVGDAMHTQRKLSVEVVRNGGHYIWTAKGNQMQVMETIAHLFEPEPVTPGFAPTPTDFKVATSVNKGHGRIEKRTICSDPKNLDRFSPKLRGYLLG